MARKFAWVRWAALGLTVVLLSQAVASAQPGGDRGRRPGGFPGFPSGGWGGGGPGGAISSSLLLRNEKVQQELAIDADQQKKIDAVLDASRAKTRELFSGLGDLTEEQRREKFAELRTKGEAAAAELTKQLAEVLSPTQTARLDQILLQQRGINALQDEKVAAKLEINAEQKQKLTDVFASQREMQTEIFGGFRNLQDLTAEERTAKFAELRTKGDELRKETETAVLEVLTDAQKAKFTELKGKAFELDRSQLFQGFGRGRPGEGGPRRPDGERPATPKQPGA